MEKLALFVAFILIISIGHQHTITCRFFYKSYGTWKNCILVLVDVYRLAIIQLTVLGEHILFMNISRVEAFFFQECELKLSSYIFFLIVLLQVVLG
jgi:hypothetical protein